MIKTRPKFVSLSFDSDLQLLTEHRKHHKTPMCLQNFSHKRGTGKYHFPKYLPRFQQSTFQGILEDQIIFFLKPLQIFSCRHLSTLHFDLFVFATSLTFSDKKVLRKKHKTTGKMRNQEVRQLEAMCLCDSFPSFQWHQTPSQELTEMNL